MVFAAQCGLGVYSDVFGPWGTWRGACLHRVSPAGRWKMSLGLGHAVSVTCVLPSKASLSQRTRHLVASVSPNVDPRHGPLHF